MTRWMWWCVVASLTLVLGVSWVRPRVRGLTISRGPDSTEPPQPACPPQTLETEGVCVPVPEPTANTLDALKPPGDTRLGSGADAVTALPAALQIVAGTPRELALAEAAVPQAWRAAGRAFAIRPLPGATVVCPSLPSLRILALDAADGWVLLESASTAGPGAVFAILIAGLRSLDAGISVGGACPSHASLGTARDQVVLSARRVTQPFGASGVPPDAWFVRGTHLELNALLPHAQTHAPASSATSSGAVPSSALPPVAVPPVAVPPIAPSAG